MTSKARAEHRRIQRLIHRINAAGGDAEHRYHHRQHMIEYVIRENGKTVFQEFAWLDHDWTEAKLRKIRHQMEIAAAKVDIVDRSNAA